LYKFRVRAKNAINWGPYSSEVTFIPAEAPSTMASLTTSNDGTNVKIMWTAPDNNGASITAYKIKIRHSDGTYVEDTTYCNG
jgi:hypothetical protein